WGNLPACNTGLPACWRAHPRERWVYPFCRPGQSISRAVQRSREQLSHKNKISENKPGDLSQNKTSLVARPKWGLVGPAFAVVAASEGFRAGDLGGFGGWFGRSGDGRDQGVSRLDGGFHGFHVVDAGHVGSVQDGGGEHGGRGEFELLGIGFGEEG